MEDNDYNLITDYSTYFLRGNNKKDSRFDLYRLRLSKALDKAIKNQLEKQEKESTDDIVEVTLDPVESETTFVPTEQEAEVHDYLSQYKIAPAPSTYHTSFSNTSRQLRATEAMAYLTNPQGHNLNKTWAAALVGVLNSESGLIPGIENKEEAALYGANAGKGIAQWSNERRAKYDAAMAGKQGTLQDELDYVMLEIKSDRPELYKYINEHKDVSIDEAVDIIHRWYENGGKQAATREQITATYTPRWEKLGLGAYNFDQQQANRIGSAKLMLTLI